MKKLLFISLGNANTGKTIFLQKLLKEEYDNSVKIRSKISLISNQNIIFWDCEHTIKNFNYFIIINNIKVVLLFCNLLNNRSCLDLDYWKNLWEKHAKDNFSAEIIVVGTYLGQISDRQSKIIHDNKIKSLEWCVSNGDLPFFEINLDNNTEISNMYNSIVKHF